MGVADKPQTSIYEKEIEDEALEKALEERDTAKIARGEANAAFALSDDKVKAKLDALDIADAPVRCGRFVIERKHVAAKTVSFETDPTTKLSIKTVEE